MDKLIWQLRANLNNKQLAHTVAEDEGVEWQEHDGWLILETEQEIEVAHSQLARAYGVEVDHPYVEVLVGLLFDYLQGQCVLEANSVVLRPPVADSSERGWHVVVDDYMHRRWELAANRLGLTKKALTIISVEYFLRTVLERDPEQAYELVAEWQAE